MSYENFPFAFGKHDLAEAQVCIPQLIYSICAVYESEPGYVPTASNVR